MLFLRFVGLDMLGRLLRILQQMNLVEVSRILNGVIDMFSAGN
jgi:hypothetical protein